MSKRNSGNSGLGGGKGLWPVLLVLLPAVLVPTACVLWFMNAAMRNEHLAVRQRLTDVYRQQLSEGQKRLDEFWLAKREVLDRAGTLSPAEAFAEIVKSGSADSAIVYGSSGQVAYPSSPGTAGGMAGGVSRHADTQPSSEPASQPAEVIETVDPLADAHAYAKFAASTRDVHLAGRALQAQARCLARAGQSGQAAAVLAELGKVKYVAARDDHGRLIACDALLYAIQLARARGGNGPADAAAELASRLNNYGDPEMPSAQRMFLMAQLQSLTGLAMPMLAAEQLAEQGVLAMESEEAGPTTSPELRRGLARIEGLWAFGSSNGRVEGLFGDDSLRQGLHAVVANNPSLVGAQVTLHYGQPAQGEAEAFLAVPAGQHMLQWRLALYLDDPNLFAAAAARQNAVYLWSAGAGVLAIVLFSASIAAYLGRQIRLTRLKNDFIATVSHELKTPLASMRVLVDTLREGRCTSSRQAGEYFDLIAKENQRLSRLIDNFLTFSRMERNKQAFEFTAVDVGDVVRSAAAAVGERFSGGDYRLSVDVPSDLPPAQADRDALETVILNLLDNAWKYSGQHKVVSVRAFAEDGGICIAVSDNGVGLSRRAARRIFDKFYQVDQTLSRKAGGCGLGLAIVKFILDAHGGSIAVKSQGGKGSTFTVKLPSR